MAYFRKKPVVVEAYLYEGGPLPCAAPDWVAEATEPCGIITNTGFVTERLRVKTLEGKMYANPNDWIIRGVQGEVYACKPDVFEATYTPLPSDKE